MQISPGMKVSDVCMFCFEHTNDQPCPSYDAWAEQMEIEAGNDEEPDDTCHCGHPDCGAC